MKNDSSGKIKSGNALKISDNIYAIVLSFIGAVGINGIMAAKGGDISYTNSFLSFIIFILSIYFIRRIAGGFRAEKTANKVYSYIFSCLLSMALHMGASLERYDNVDFRYPGLYLYTLCFCVYFAPVADYLWKKAPQVVKGYFCADKAEKRPEGVKIWAMIFILWLPTFFALFPGAFVYDATEEYTEVISRSFTMHHPLLHVLLLGGIVHFAEYIGLSANIGIAVYTVLQMVVFSGVFAYLIVWVGNRGMSRRYQLLCTVFFGLFPVFPMYAVCSAKDTLFTAAFLLIVLLLNNRIYETEKFYDRKMILFVFASSLMMLFRNNGFYAYIASIPVVIIIGLCTGENKKQISRIVVLMALSVVLYLGANQCLKIATHAIDDENQEKLTVAIQQLARVYKYSPDTFSEDELEKLYEVLPQEYLITYNPRISDVLKSGFNNQAYSSDMAGYKRLWLNIGMRKPLIYLNAWLVNSYGYWYPDMIINVYGGNRMYTFTYKDSSYFGFETEPPGERNSLFPLLEKFYRNISLELFQQKVPVISMLFSPGFAFWIFMWVMFGFIRDGRWSLTGAYSSVLLLCGTVLLGPTVLVRYVLILWCIIPMLFYDLAQTDEVTGE